MLELIYPAKNVLVLNPTGNIAIVTCWSYPTKVLEEFKKYAKWDTIAPAVVCLGTLYGNGFADMLRNLAYNPQINQILIVGRDRSQSGKDLVEYFAGNATLVDSLGTKRFRVGSRTIPADVFLNRFMTIPAVTYRCDAYTRGDMDEVFDSLLAPLHGGVPPRQKWDIPRDVVETLPSNVTEHTVVADTPFEAYKLAVQKVLTFGTLAQLPKGNRYELLNLKVVIRNPEFTPEVFKAFKETYPDFTEEKFKAYYDETFATDDTRGMAYTYGSRLVGCDGLRFPDRVGKALLDNPEYRKGYHSLFLPSDITSSDPPCLVGLYVRAKKEIGVILSSIFRTHNLMTAWPMNVYGLSRVQQEICETSGQIRGPLVVYSHSISISPDGLELAKFITNRLIHYRFKEDPIGHFIISLDEGKIKATLSDKDGINLRTYEGRTAEQVHYKLVEVGILNDVSHAMYIGRMLQRAQYCLENNLEFTQE